MVIIKFFERLLKKSGKALFGFLLGISMTSFSQTKIEVEVLPPYSTPTNLFS